MTLVLPEVVMEPPLIPALKLLLISLVETAAPAVTEAEALPVFSTKPAALVTIKLPPFSLAANLVPL